MREPVTAADEMTYERAEITKWLNMGKTTSPVTGAELEHTQLVNSQALKVLIAEYRAGPGAAIVKSARLRVPTLVRNS